MNIGRQLRNARRRASLSQQSLAELMQVERPTISQIESEARTTTLEKTARWAAICSHEVLVLPVVGERIDEPDDEEAAVLAAVRAALPRMTPRERAVLRLEAELILSESHQGPKK